MSILIVDDSAAQRLALATMLEQHGYADLLGVGSAEEALACLSCQPAPEVELILTDLNMPGLNGIDVCRRVKAMPEWQDVPIIVVTSSHEVHDLQLAFAAGAMDYIIKPPNDVELIARVRSALRLKREMDARKQRERQLHALNGELERVLGSLAAQHRLLEIEQKKSEQLLLNILPGPIAERLKQRPGVIADQFACVTVLFADLVDFTRLAAAMASEQVVGLLNTVFSRFDQLAEQHGLEKIKTIGDAYMAVGGLPTPRPDHARAVAAMALDMLSAVASLEHPALKLRIGLHSGPVVAGVIGKKKFSYDLWGDTVNVASRMEAQGLAGRIQITEATYQLIRDAFRCEPRGKIFIKGKGEMPVWHLLGWQCAGLLSQQQDSAQDERAEAA